MYTESLSYFPTYYKLSKSIGRTQRLLGNHSQSIKIFKNLIKGVPLSGERNFELAKSYFADGKINQALKHLDITLDTWKDADTTFKSAIEAREKWIEWNQSN